MEEITVIDLGKAKAWFMGWPVIKGGPGSGNFGHSGIPGQHGGSMPGGFSFSGGWAAPKALAGQPDLKGESTASLQRTISRFKRDIKETTSPMIRHNFQGGIENIQQELTYRGKLRAAARHLKKGRSKVKPDQQERIDTAIKNLEDMIKKREGKQ